MFEQTFKNIDDVLWKEAGCATELDYTEQTSWILFLKYLDDLEKANEQKAELAGKKYAYIIDKTAPLVGMGRAEEEGRLVRSRQGADRRRSDRVRRREAVSLPEGLQRPRAEGANTIEYKIGEIFGEIKNKFQSRLFAARRAGTDR